MSLNRLVILLFFPASLRRSRQPAITGSFSTLTRWQASVHRIVSVIMREAAYSSIRRFVCCVITLSSWFTYKSNKRGAIKRKWPGLVWSLLTAFLPSYSLPITSLYKTSFSMVCITYVVEYLAYSGRRNSPLPNDTDCEIELGELVYHAPCP